MANLSFLQWLGLYLIAGVLILVLFKLFIKFMVWFASKPTVRQLAPETSKGVVDSVSELKKVLDDQMAPIVLAMFAIIWPVMLGFLIYVILKKEKDAKPVE